MNYILKIFWASIIGGGVGAGISLWMILKYQIPPMGEFTITVISILLGMLLGGFIIKKYVDE